MFPTISVVDIINLTLLPPFNSPLASVTLTLNVLLNESKAVAENKLAFIVSVIFIESFSVLYEILGIPNIFMLLKSFVATLPKWSVAVTL